MTHYTTQAPMDHSADEGSLVTFFTTAIIVLAGALMVATSFSLI